MVDRDPNEPGPLSRLRTELAGPRGWKRVDALLSEQDAAGAIAALSPPEIFELVTQVGFNDTQELIELATPEQLRGCIDLDAWDRDQILIEPMKPWLAAIMATGAEKTAEVWARLDAELRALFIQRQAVIYDLSLGEEFDDEDGRAEMLFTVDTFFCLKLTGDEDGKKLLRQLLEDLYSTDPDLARHTIMAARSEPPAELEENAYRWRAGRMADFGYVDFYEALDLFAPLEPDKVTIGEGTEDRFGPVIEEGAPRLPLSIAEEVLGRSFLARALDRLDAADSLRVQGAVVVLTNRVLAAARIKPGDLEALRRGAHYATATLSLGLEVVARGDVERAAQALRTVSLTRLHRVGYTVPLKLARLARGLAPLAATAGAPTVPMLAAVLALRPWMSRALDPDPQPGVRPFESQADVRRVAETLARLALRIAIAESLGVDLAAMAQAPEPRPGLDDHARTAMVRAMIGDLATAEALTDDEMRRFRTTAFSGDMLDDDAGERAASAITRRLDEQRVTAGREPLAALVAGWLADLERMFAPLEPAEIDGRFVEGVLVASARS